MENYRNGIIHYCHIQGWEYPKSYKEALDIKCACEKNTFCWTCEYDDFSNLFEHKCQFLTFSKVIGKYPKFWEEDELKIEYDRCPWIKGVK
jgi:hypothetical protein